ncbi:MAG: hypothetical protein A2W91_00050 [Bacteroidetes bacterium GWF2_38_335]|nr:MAG: hypothetical protein A2W91_00050 [Bacteroidetes bacterium GWF2_38_335]OFY79712.1 MAG: hypothetical protein A2281_09645 [Bacteroidetes bacterium RIFOXYA12_FULL_38_20]HBS87582.1 nucleoside-diphosphate sugar epimerase [Bacteroidales bacterium]
MILVTGSSGLLGSHLLFALASRGKEIKAVIRSEKSIRQIEKVFSYYTDEPGKYLSKITWLHGDLLNYEDVKEMTAGIEEVFHTAAIVSYKKSDRGRIISENTLMAQNVVNACQSNKVRRLCHISSIAALGDQDKLITEETSYDMTGRNSAYSSGKFRAELEVWRGIAEGLDAVILNPSVIIGPGDWNRSSCALFKTVDRGLKFYTEGTTGFVDVRDVARCAIDLMEGNTVNQKFIINSQNTDYLTLFTEMALALGKKPPIIKVNPAMAKLACFLEHLRTLMTGKSPVITHETARISMKKLQYSAEKIINKTGIAFIPVKESVKHTASIFLRETRPRS